MTSSARRLPVAVLTLALAGSLVAGFADQQLAGNNPRAYDFRAALASVRSQARPGDTLLYAPNYLADVIDYYTPGVRPQLIGSGKPRIPPSGKVFLLGSFLDQPSVASDIGTARYTLGHSRLHLVATRHLEKIYVWEYR